MSRLLFLWLLLCMAQQPCFCQLTDGFTCLKSSTSSPYVYTTTSQIQTIVQLSCDTSGTKTCNCGSAQLGCSIVYYNTGTGNVPNGALQLNPSSILGAQGLTYCTLQATAELVYTSGFSKSCFVLNLYK